MRVGHYLDMIQKNKLMQIVIKSIPQEQQRYPTTGDYFQDPDGTWQLRVSQMGNEDAEFLVALHEMVEMWLARKHGISEETITDFDLLFEQECDNGQHKDNGEPGDDPRSPYQYEHCVATAVERMVCAAFPMNWNEYEALFPLNQDKVKDDDVT